MDRTERATLASLRSLASARIERESLAAWDARRRAATELLAAVNDAWWTIHQQDPSAYERDLLRLNALAGWTGVHAQLATWRSSQGEAVLMPPKFFGGDPRAVDEMFVASLTLNHATLDGPGFAAELSDQQTANDCFSAHRDYFTRWYAYKKFFGARARVLDGYATRAGRHPVPPSEDWRGLNHRFTLYVEAFPTRSRRFQRPPQTLAPGAFDREVFVCALNTIAHDIVLQLLRPRRVLLAGRQT